MSNCARTIVRKFTVQYTSLFYTLVHQFVFKTCPDRRCESVAEKYELFNTYVHTETFNPNSTLENRSVFVMLCNTLCINASPFVWLWTWTVCGRLSREKYERATQMRMTVRLCDRCSLFLTDTTNVGNRSPWSCKQCTPLHHSRNRANPAIDLKR